MSSMNNFMEAYKAVHNKEAKEEFYAKRDFITEMNLATLFDADLVDITEQVVAKLFETMTVAETKSLVEKAFSDTPSVQQHKVARLIEAFKTVFRKVDETAATVARESFSQYLDRKRLERNKSVMNSIEESHARIHRHKNAGEIENVKNLLISMMEKKKLDPVGKEDEDIDNDGDVDSSDKYLHKRRKAIGKAMGKKDVKEEKHEDEKEEKKDKKKGKKCPKCDGKGCKHCNGKGTHFSTDDDSEENEDGGMDMGEMFSQQELEKIQKIVESWEG